MNKNKKWLLAISVAAMVAASGIVMAAASNDKQEDQNSKRPAFADREDFGKQEGMRPIKHDNTALLKLLKIDNETFRAEIKSGKTLVTIAKEHGVSEQKLKDFMIKEMTKHLEQGVKEGRIPADKAEQMKAQMDKRVSDMINGKGPMHMGHRPMHDGFKDSKLPELLNISAEQLKDEMKDGKTLVAIAKEHDVSEDQLKDFMVKEMTARIDKGVEEGRIPAEKAEQMKARMDQRVSDMINGKRPMHHGFRDSKLPALLNISHEELKKEMKDGKTLVTIAKEHDVSEQQLKDFIVKEMTERINKGVEEGRITTDRAEKMKANLDNRVSDMINGKRPHHEHQQGGN